MTTTTTTTRTKSICFWAILSIENLKFEYIPSTISNTKILGQSIGNLLLNRSLFEIIHPNETELAKSDLSTFIQLKTLAGSVTRCRLRSLQTISTLLTNNQNPYFKSNNTSATNQNNDSEWNIIDLVIYTATDDTVLVFFHNTDIESYTEESQNLSCCQSRNTFPPEDTDTLIQIMSSRTQHKPINAALPIRIFQIVDQMTGSPLFIWPSKPVSNVVEIVPTISKEMLLKEFKSSTFDQQQNEISCTRHFYASSKQEFLNRDCLFQRILIPYGNIIFESFQVSLLSDINSIACSSLYQHYYLDTILKDTKGYYNSIYHNISSPPPVCNTTTNELAIGEVETQILPGNLLDAVTTRCSPTQNTSCHSPPSLFQKFRLQHEDKERKKKLVVFNHHQHQFTTTSHPTTSLNNLQIKVCTRCRTSNSPEWRRGPDGHKTLCNACGLRYSRLRSKQWRSNSTTTKNK